MGVISEGGGESACPYVGKSLLFLLADRKYFANSIVYLEDIPKLDFILNFAVCVGVDSLSAFVDVVIFTLMFTFLSNSYQIFFIF